LPGQFVLDMHADDVLEAVLDPKPERPRALGIEPGRPARYDLDDRRIGFTADARNNCVTRDAAQRRNLLADRTGDTRHGEIDARAERFARQRRGMDEKARS